MILSVSTVEVWRGSIDKPNDENSNSNKLWSVKRDSEKQIYNCTRTHVHIHAHALLESIVGMQLGISTNLRVFGSGGRKQDNFFSEAIDAVRKMKRTCQGKGSICLSQAWNWLAWHACKPAGYLGAFWWMGPNILYLITTSQVDCKNYMW